MTISAVCMALLGVVTSLLPRELLSWAGSSPVGLPVLLIQVTGGLYFGFAILNWMARGVLIGGIYSRPLAMGNFMHFAVVSIVLIKTLVANFSAFVLAGAIPYSLFALWFGMVVFTHPGIKP
jgi:hypothetical protein